MLGKYKLWVHYDNNSIKYMSLAFITPSKAFYASYPNHFHTQLSAQD